MTRPRTTGIAILLTLLWPASFSIAQEEESGAASAEATGEIEEVRVVGSRRLDRSAADSPVPVDVVGADELLAEADSDMDSLLASQVPSYNVNAQPISDAATFMRPANLRALPPDATLVLVNGKRRHRGAVITFLGGGTADGSQGPDVAAIPAIALDRIEVLRDGASAQYGSDAIAGVINFVLRDDPDARALQIKGGQYQFGDGTRYAVSGLFGLPISPGGQATLSFEYGTAEPTNRSIQRTDAAALIGAGNRDVRQPHAQIWGTPELHYDYKGFLNGSFELNADTELYYFGNISGRDVEGGFFFRNPNTRGGVFSADGGETILVADLGDDTSDCPVVTITDNRPDADALAAVAADPNCYAFNERFPGGFTPQFGGEINDQSFAAGMRGTFMDDWNYDVSFVWGHSGIAFYIYNTINPQLVDRMNNIPTHYNPGEYDETDIVTNLDLSRPFDVAWGSGPLHLAMGAEVRQENFQITAGDPDSWAVNPLFAAQGFGIGSNGFPGFQDSAEIDAPRNSTSLWIDFEQNVTDVFLGSFALRFEDYEDFGTTLDWKFAGRLELEENAAIRGAISTGFRAPTAGQANVRNVTTAFIGGVLADEATLPPTHPISVLKGGEVLQPEESVNVTLGFIFSLFNIDMTFDYFNIQVSDRIALTSTLPLSSADIDELLALGVTDASSFTGVRFFTNDFETTTRGLDFVATTDLNIGAGNTSIVFAANWTDTSVDKYNPNIISKDVRVKQLEGSIPSFRHTTTVNHSWASWNLMVRFRAYGEYYESHLDSPGLDLNLQNSSVLDAEVTRDIEGDMGDIAVTLGVQNLLDKHPEKNPYFGIAGAVYPNISPFGFNGAYYYFRSSIQF